MNTRLLAVEKKTRITPLLLISLLAIFSFLLKDYNLPMLAGYGMFIIFALPYVTIGHGRISLTRTQVAAFLLACVASVMVILPYASTEIRTLSVIMSLDIAMLYILISKPNEKDIYRTLRILLIAAVVMSFYAVLVDINPNIYFNIVKRILPSDTQKLIELGFRYHYGISVGGESIVVDYYAFFGMVISLNTLLICGKKLEKRNQFILIIVLCMIAIIMQNRKAELVTSIVVVTFLFLSNVNVTTIKKKWKQILAFLMLAFIAVLGFFWLLRHGYLSRYETFFSQLAIRNTEVFNTVDISSGRMRLWNLAFSLFTEHPIFGIGWGNFRLYLADTYNVFNDGQLSNVHNNYLQLLCETGIVGFLLFAGLLFYIFFRTIKCIRILRNTETNNYLARIAASTSLSFQMFYLVISFIDPVWYKMFTWPFYGISIIMLVYAEREISVISL